MNGRVVRPTAVICGNGGDSRICNRAAVNTVGIDSVDICFDVRFMRACGLFGEQKMGQTRILVAVIIVIVVGTGAYWYLRQSNELSAPQTGGVSNPQTGGVSNPAPAGEK